MSTAAIVGALTYLGSVSFGETAITAYADENGTLVFSIYVLSKEELPIVALDLNVAAGEKPKPLQGANITITKSAEGEPKTVVLDPTDRCGFAPLNVRSISLNKSSDTASHYEAWGSIYAEHSGYQIYEEEDTYFVSGLAPDKDNKLPNTIYVPMAKDTGGPYLSMASFDGLDVLHTEREALIASTNNYSHTLNVKLRNAGNKSWNFVLLSDGNPIAKVTGVVPTNGVAQAQFKGTWLDGKSGVKIGSTMAVGFVEASSSGKGTQVSLKAVFKESFGGAQVKSNLSMMGNFHDDSDIAKKKKSERSSSWIPLPPFITRPDDSLMIGAPVSPLQFVIWPNGQMAVLLQVKSGSMAWQGEGSQFSRKDGDFWKPLTPTALYNSYSERVKQEWKGFKDSLAPETGRAIRPVTSELSLSLNFTLQGIGNVNHTPVEGKTNTYRGKLDFSFETEIAAKAEFTLPFNMSFIPMYIGVDFSFSAAVRMLLGATYDVQVTDSGPNKLSGFRFNAANESKYGQSLAPYVKLHMEAGFSLAVGLKNVAAMGVRAYGFILMTFDFTAVDNPGHYPISVGKIQAKIQAFVQLLFFKKTFKLRDLAEKTLFDNRANSAGLLSANDECFNQPYYTGVGANGEAALEVVGENDLFCEFSLSLVDWDTALTPLYEEVYWTAHESTPNISVSSLYKQKGQSYVQCGAEEVYDSNITYYRCLAPQISALQVARPASAPLPTGYSESMNAFNTATTLILDPYSTANNGSAAYNPISGIRPAQVLPIRNKAFSDARTQIACSISDDYDIPNYMFRIATVEVAPHAGQVAYKQTSGNANFSYIVPVSSVPANSNAVFLGADEKPVRSRVVYSTCKRYDKDAVGSVNWSDEQLLPLDESVIDRTNRWDVDFDVLNSYGQHMFVAVVTSTRPQDGDKSFSEMFNNQYVSLWVKDHGGLKGKGLNLTLNCSAGGPDASDAPTMWNPRIAASIFHRNGDPRQVSAMDIDDVDFHTKVYFYQKAKTEEIGTAAVSLGYAEFLINSVNGVYPDKGDIKYTNYGTCTLPSCFGTGAGKYRLEEGTFSVHQHQPVCYKTGATLDNYKGGKGTRVIAWSCPSHDGKKATIVVWDEARPDNAMMVENVSSFVKVPLRTLSKGHDDSRRSHDDKILFLYVVDEAESESKLMYGIEFDDSSNTLRTQGPLLRTSFVNMFCDPVGESLYIVRSMEGEAPKDTISRDDAERVNTCYGAYGQYSSASACMNADAIGTGSESSANGNDKVALYQVLRADRRYQPKADGSFVSSYFYDFYPYFQTDFPIDNLSYLAVDDSKHTAEDLKLVKFFVTTTAEADTTINSNADTSDPLATNTATLRMLKVPATEGMQIDSVDLNTTFCVPGQKVVLQVVASNTGMRPIKSFKVRVKRKTGPVSSVEVTFNNFEKTMVVPAEAYVKEVNTTTGKQLDTEKIDPLICGDMTTFYPGSTRKFVTDITLPIAADEHGTFGFEAELIEVTYGYIDAVAEEGHRYAATSTWDASATQSPTFDPFTSYVSIVDTRAKSLSQEVHTANEVFEILFDIANYSDAVSGDWTPVYPPDPSPSVTPSKPTEEEIKKMDTSAVEEAAAAVEESLPASGAIKATADEGGSFQLPAVSSASGSDVRYEKLDGAAKITVSENGLVTVKPGLKAGVAYIIDVDVICGGIRQVVKLKVKVS